MRLTYYPGCSLDSTAVEYNTSTRAVFEALGVELVELEDWNCCGATPAHATNRYLGLALPLRNLILAERAGNDLVAPCAACYNVMRYTDHAARNHSAAADKAGADLEAVMGTGYGGTITVRHPLEILSGQDMLAAVRAKAVRTLAGLKLVTYYGCLLSRPKKIVAFDDPDHPESMDKILTALGAGVCRWSYKTDCCGGALSMAQTDAVATLVAKLAGEARRAGAQAIVTACPLCAVNLDTRQTKVARPLPVLYFTELMGLALGLPARDWLARHIVDPSPVIGGER
jgi:Heterodisulfide reductase, subunit B